MRRSLTLAILLLAAACGDAGTTTTPPLATSPPPATTNPTTTAPPPTTTTAPPPTTTTTTLPPTSSTTTLPATTTTTLPESFPLPTGADVVVLQLDYAVNQPDALKIVEAYPAVTVYGDGRVIFDDRTAERRALPALLEARLAPEGIQVLVAEAARRGTLTPLDSYGITGITDADATLFRVNAGSHQSDFGVYALGNVGSEMTQEQRRARLELERLETALLGWMDLVPEHIAAPPVPYEAETVLVLADGGADRRNTGDRALPHRLRDEFESYETRINDISCAEAAGDLLVEILPLIRAAEPDLPWLVGDDAYRLRFRPVLPHEPGCDIVPLQ